MAEHIALGYHSPTEWIFVPALNSMYESLTINAAALEHGIEKGMRSRSSYLRRKAEALTYLRDKGRLVPKPYEVSDEHRSKLSEVVDFFFSTCPGDMRRLAAGAFAAFADHERGTAEQLMHPDDEYSRDVFASLAGWRDAEASLLAGAPLAGVPGLKPALTRYFEECLFTPTLFPDEYNPVFQWEGYAPFQEFLLARRLDKEKWLGRVRKGSAVRVLQAVAETAVPFRPLRNVDELGRLDAHFTAFEGVRRFAREQNEAIWKNLRAARDLDLEKDSGEFVQDFESLLRSRIRAIETEVRDADAEIEHGQTSLTFKVKRYFAQTIGSVTPLMGGVSSWLEDLFALHVEQKALERHPVVSMLRDYELTMDKVILERTPLEPSCHAGEEYVPHKFWDAE